MRKQISIIFLLLCLGCVSLFAQEPLEKKPFVLLRSVEGVFELGSGGGGAGLQVKANHGWWENQGTVLQSGVGVAAFHGNESYEIPPSVTTGYSIDSHFRFYSGLEQSFMKSRNAFFFVEGYAGGLHAYTKGNWSHPDLGADRDFKSSELFFDYGTRLGGGYRIKGKWGVQLSLTNSWRKINAGLGPLAGLFAGEPDGKMSLGIGLNYKF